MYCFFRSFYWFAFLVSMIIGLFCIHDGVCVCMLCVQSFPRPTEFTYLLTRSYLHTKFEVWRSNFFLRYYVNKDFRLSPLVTSNDLWPMKFNATQWVQPLHQFTAASTSWDTMFTRCLEIDLCWPQVTSMKNKDNLPSRGYLHTKFEVEATSTSWDYYRVYKPRRRTHTRHHHRIYFFGLQQGIKNATWNSSQKSLQSLPNKLFICTFNWHKVNTRFLLCKWSRMTV